MMKTCTNLQKTQATLFNQKNIGNILLSHHRKRKIKGNIHLREAIVPRVKEDLMKKLVVRRNVSLIEWLLLIFVKSV